MEEDQNNSNSIPVVQPEPVPETEPQPVEQPVQENPVSEVQETPTNPPAPPMPPSRKSGFGFGKILKFLLIIVFLMAAVGGGYYVYKKRPFNLKLSAITKIFNKNSNQQGQDENSVTTYTNETYKYQFSFPNGFDIVKNSDESEVYVYKKDANVPLSAKYFAVNYYNSAREYPSDYTKQYVEINDLMTLRIIGKEGFTVYQIDVDNGVLEIEVASDSDKQELANQIFSSFKLVSDNESAGAVIDSLAIAHDTQRKADLTKIANAIYTYSSENNGDLPGGYDKFPVEPTCIGSSNECYNLANLGVINPLPQDPTTGSEGNTGYEIFKRTDGRIVLTAKGENEKLIQVVR
jgi:hypothetical protein